MLGISNEASWIGVPTQHLKRYLKQFPFLVSAKNFLWRATYALAVSALGVASRFPFFHSRLFRQMTFDLSSNPNELLISVGRSERLFSLHPTEVSVERYT